MEPVIVQTYTTDPWCNLALEETIMESVSRGEAVFYLWQNQNTVVIGRNQNAWQECRCSLMETEGCRLARRRSGGGAVFHDIGNLNFTFVAPPEIYDLKRQNGVIIEACRSLGIDAEYTGRNDITVEGRKISGCAFMHTQRCSMQHGTLLISADMAKMGRYLVPSEEKLRSKGVASVRARVANLVEFKKDITVPMVRETLCRAFENEYGMASRKSAEDFPAGTLEKLYERNSSWDWNYGETPKFDAEMKKRFAWGGVQMLLTFKNGIVSSSKVYTDSMDPDLAERLETMTAGLRCGSEMAAALKEKANGDEQIEDVAGWLSSI